MANLYDYDRPNEQTKYSSLHSGDLPKSSARGVLIGLGIIALVFTGIFFMSGTDQQNISDPTTNSSPVLIPEKPAAGTTQPAQ